MAILNGEKMKHLILYFFAMIFTVFFTGTTLLTPISCFEEAVQKPAAKQHSIQTKEFNIAKGKTIDIDLKSGGSIKISGWDKNVVSIRSNGDDAETYLKIIETSDGLSVSTEFDTDDGHGENIDLDINVPKEFNVKIETMGGEVKLADISGEISGQTMGGDLEFRRLKGDINFTTMGGEIHLTDSDLSGKLHTMGGEVNFENVTGGVNGSSMGGNVSMKNVTMPNGKSSGDKVLITSMGGNIDVDDAASGADVQTMGGNIDIRKAAQFVKAKTMGGDIVLRSIDGGVKATTMGGDIDVNVTGGNNGDKNISLVSMGGDITLTVPAELSMDIDIILSYTKNREGDYDIKSDFDLKKEVSDKWENKHGGTPRKNIHASGKTGEGKYKVKIETINGNVILKRG
jgi:hypothetical protein